MWELSVLLTAPRKHAASPSPSRRRRRRGSAVRMSRAVNTAVSDCAGTKAEGDSLREDPRLLSHWRLRVFVHTDGRSEQFRGRGSRRRERSGVGVLGRVGDLIGAGTHVRGHIQLMAPGGPRNAGGELAQTSGRALRCLESNIGSTSLVGVFDFQAARVNCHLLIRRPVTCRPDARSPFAPFSVIVGRSKPKRYGWNFTRSVFPSVPTGCIRTLSNSLHTGKQSPKKPTRDI